MSNEAVVGKGARVTLHYTLSLAGGKTVESSRAGAPVALVIGASDWLPALEERLIGLAVGERRVFDIPCAEAYGPARGPEVHAVAREDFPPELRLEPGVVVGFDLPSGEEVPGTVVEVTGREVMVDFSHPLAGHDLVLDVEILDVEILDVQVLGRAES
jgi:FKBP-type peptidyl-prolyl cis-trans isomerase SlpA